MLCDRFGVGICTDQFILRLVFYRVLGSKGQRSFSTLTLERRPLFSGCVLPPGYLSQILSAQSPRFQLRALGLQFVGRRLVVATHSLVRGGGSGFGDLGAVALPGEGARALLDLGLALLL